MSFAFDLVYFFSSIDSLHLSSLLAILMQIITDNFVISVESKNIYRFKKITSNFRLLFYCKWQNKFVTIFLWKNVSHSIPPHQRKRKKNTFINHRKWRGRSVAENRNDSLLYCPRKTTKKKKMKRNEFQY